MINAGAIEHRRHANSSRAQPAAEIVVFTAPTNEIFIKAVDSLIFGAAHCEIRAAEGGLRRVPDQAVTDRLVVHLPQLAELFTRRPLDEIAAADRLQCDML